jgi:very-short-patch-repair endonuclease
MVELYAKKMSLLYNNRPRGISLNLTVQTRRQGGKVKGWTQEAIDAIKQRRGTVPPRDPFIALLKSERFPVPETEYRFHPVRKFRFDYAWPNEKVALEVEGGVWNRGAHGRGTGIVRDMEKYNLAATMGWKVLRVLPKDLPRDETLAMLAHVLGILEAWGE